jgi:hypothetical protein
MALLFDTCIMLSEDVENPWSIPWDITLNERQSLNEIRNYLHTHGRLDRSFILQGGLSIEQFSLLYLLKNYRKRMRVE